MLGGTPKRRGEGRQMERGREGETGRNANEWSASGGLKRHPKQRQREMNAWTGPDYVVYATMLIEYGQITRGRQIRES